MNATDTQARRYAIIEDDKIICTSANLVKLARKATKTQLVCRWSRVLNAWQVIP